MNLCTGDNSQQGDGIRWSLQLHEERGRLAMPVRTGPHHWYQSGLLLCREYFVSTKVGRI